MTKFFVPALAAAAAMLPATASAQQLPDAKVAVVDVETAARTCTACAVAWANIEQQVQQAQAFEQQVSTPLQTEGQQIQAEIRALNGAQPGEALQQRAAAFDQRRQQAAQQIQQRRATLQRNQNYVLQQISAQLEPAYTAVLTARRAHVIVPKSSVMAHSSAVDVTNDVIAQLNRTLTTVATVAPTPQQPAAQPTTPTDGR